MILCTELYKQADLNIHQEFDVNETIDSFANSQAALDFLLQRIEDSSPNYYSRWDIIEAMALKEEESIRNFSQNNNWTMVRITIKNRLGGFIDTFRQPFPTIDLQEAIEMAQHFVHAANLTPEDGTVQYSEVYL